MGLVLTSVMSDALERVEAPGEERVFFQQFEVAYDYPVYFTRDLFSPGNTALIETLGVEALGGERGAARTKVAVFVDDGVTREMPDLPRRIAAFAERGATGSSSPVR